jgi:adenine-specific DNA-methyltransferase
VKDLGEALARGERLRLSISAEHRKQWGQYVTPAKLVAFMAELAAAGPVSRCVRVLDPGAGTGSLGLALTQELLEQRRVGRVELVGAEHEPEAHRQLSATMFVARRSYDGQRLAAEALGGDFLRATAGTGYPTLEPFDIAIGNPPYFKLSPTDKRGGGDAPNIYARFMAVSASLLREGGRMVFVVPRSYLSGSYFRRFRQQLHEMMQLEAVHIFDSRATFGRDGVLQESIVVTYTKRRAEPLDVVRLSTSAGLDDLDQRQTFMVARERLVTPDGVWLPTSFEQLELGRRIRGLDSTIASLGLSVSTGPVVPFRCTELAGADETKPTVPLLWMQHVARGKVTWPIDFRKPERMRLPSRDLVPRANYVLVRRVSAKEDARRITAAPLIASEWSTKLGLENHLNYIHRTGDRLQPAGMGEAEARGLAAVLNSQVYDSYIRMVSGTTQVSATELRALPMPRMPYIELLGQRNEEQVEALLAQILARQ